MKLAIPNPINDNVISVIAMIFLVGGVAACNAGEQFSSSNQDEPTTKEPSRGEQGGDATLQEDSHEAEQIDIPMIVSGSYLTCAETKTDFAQPYELVYGCHLKNRDTGSKVSLALIAKNWTWDQPTPTSSSVQVKIREETSPQAQHHAYYVFSGGSMEELRAHTATVSIALKMEFKDDVTNAQHFSTSLGQPPAEADQNAPADRNGESDQTSAPSPATKPTGGETDFDQDGIPDAIDLCSMTPLGEAPQTLPERMGCTPTDYLDTEDPDLDQVPLMLDRCPGTIVGDPVDLDPASPTFGCAWGQQPL